MRLLAQIFSALVLLSILALVAAMILPQPQYPTLPETGLTAVDTIVVEKSRRRMLLFQNGKIARTITIALGPSPVGGKFRQGDGRTPEGIFHINRKNSGSAYHLSLGLDYPQPADIARAKASGYSPGGDIMIHGQPNALPKDAVIKQDWTAGCIAVSNAEIEAIFAVTAVGTVVEIRP
jgi:murein L,D-transpeptidase YafK